jgi:hypothetical protein
MLQNKKSKIKIFTPNRDFYPFFKKVRHGKWACLEWQKARTGVNYGQVSVNGKVELTHRIAYLLKYGELDPKLCVLHKCDNPPCGNTKHLFTGTKKDNHKDAVNKGRAVFPPTYYGKDHPMYGRKHKQSTKIKMSLAKKGKKRNRVVVEKCRMSLKKFYSNMTAQQRKDFWHKIHTNSNINRNK